MSSIEEPSPLSENLANYIAKTSFKDIPVEAINFAKLTVLDSITCMLGGVFTPAGKIITQVIAKEGGNPESTIIGTGQKTNTLLASFTNSVLANAPDYDDYYPICHPSATIVPPGMAISESRNIDGKAFLTAVVVANEVYLRIMESILGSNKHQQKIFGFGSHQTFGAVVVAGKILQLNEAQMAQAIGIAGVNAPVASSQKAVYGKSVTMFKNNYGMSSFAGVLAAKLASAGFTGPLDIFEGETGFWRMAGSDRFDPAKMTAGLGSDFKITKISFKPYPCCRWTHSPLYGIYQILNENHISPDKVEKVEVRYYDCCTGHPFSNGHPKTFEEALFSTKYVIALAILGISPGPNWYTKEMLVSPQVLALADKVTLSSDEESNSLWPKKMLSKVTLHTGEQSFSKRVDFPLGEPENPMREEDLVKKFTQLTDGLLTDSQREQSLEFIKDIERKDDIKKLSDLLVIKDSQIKEFGTNS